MSVVPRGSRAAHGQENGAGSLPEVMKGKWESGKGMNLTYFINDYSFVENNRLKYTSIQVTV